MITAGSKVILTNSNLYPHMDGIVGVVKHIIDGLALVDFSNSPLIVPVCDLRLVMAQAS